MHWSIICQRTKQSDGAGPQVGGQVELEQTFLLGPLTCQLARAAHGLSLFTGPAFRRLFKILPHFHFAEDAFTLQFLFQGTKRLIDIIVANTDLYQWSSPSKFVAFRAKPANSPLCWTFQWYIFRQEKQDAYNVSPSIASRLSRVIAHRRSNVKR